MESYNMKYYLHKVWTSYLDYQERRAAYMTLKTLPDYLLKDMGIHRSELKYKVFHRGE